MNLFENLQIMQESKSNIKVIKEDRDNLSVSEYNKLKVALNKHNSMKGNFILHPGEVRKEKDGYNLQIAIYGAFKNQEHSYNSRYVYRRDNDVKNDEATRDGVGVQLYFVYINLIDESIKTSNVDRYYINKYVARYQKYLTDNDIIKNGEMDIDALTDSIVSTAENSKKDLEDALRSKNFIYNLTGNRKVQPSDSTNYNLNLENEALLKEAYSKDIPNEILDMIKNSSRVRDAFIKIGLDPSKMIIDKVDKFHKHNPNYIPIEIYEYDLKDGYSSSAYSSHGGTGISIGNIDINRNTGHYFTPGIHVSKTSVIGMYEIDITKNIENDAIIGDKIELRAINKNDSKNQYLDRNKPDDVLTDKSGYYTAGNFKSEYGKKWLKQRRDVMQKSVTSTNEALLKEDFDPSMPSWLARAIKMKNTNSMGHKDYSYNIPFDTMKWTVEQFPEKGKLGDIGNGEYIALLIDASGDEHKGDYIVYFPAAYIGNNETIYINGRNRRIDSMSLKSLAPYVKEYAHAIDTSDSVKNVKQIQMDRANAKSGSIDRIDKEDRYRYAYATKFDKSGYIVDPNKYVKLLAQIHQQDYANRLEDLYVVLTDVKNKIKDFISADDFLPDAKDDASAYTVYSKSKSRYFDQINKSYNDAISNYKHALGELDNISKSKNADWSNTPAYVEFNKYVKRSEESTVKVLDIIDKSK